MQDNNHNLAVFLNHNSVEQPSSLSLVQPYTVGEFLQIRSEASREGLIVPVVADENAPCSDE
jgi:hypothetical protein